MPNFRILIKLTIVFLKKCPIFEGEHRLLLLWINLYAQVSVESKKLKIYLDNDERQRFYMYFENNKRYLKLI